jgi:hypothetical protein
LVPKENQINSNLQWSPTTMQSSDQHFEFDVVKKRKAIEESIADSMQSPSAKLPRV